MGQPLNSLEARDIASLIHPHTDLAAHERRGPVLIDSGCGYEVEDRDGKRYIEAISGLWCAGLGFSEERLIQAAIRQMRKLPYYHLSAHKSHETIIELAEQLKEKAPMKASHVLFACSGSEANDTAIKIVWYANNALGRPKKKKIIARHGGYHGVTIATASLSGLPYLHRDFDLPIPHIIHTDCPHHYHFAHSGESEADFASRLANSLEALIEREGSDTIAAFIAEPIMGAGGVIVPPETYFDKIQAVLRRYDIWLIADEVICGWGRLGYHWGSELMQLNPDIVTCAKALTSAYMPMSAVMVTAPLYEIIRDNSARHGTFGHGYTYGGHPVAAAVALETLAILDERQVISHVKAIAPRLQEGLAARFSDHPLVGEVRGCGLMAAIELVADKASHRNFDPRHKLGARLATHAEEAGLIVRNLINDSIAICPPLIIDEDGIDVLITRLGLALDSLLDQIHTDGLIAA